MSPAPPFSRAFLALLALGAALAASAPASAELSRADRVRCQEALERVAWSRRSPGPGASFERAVPPSVVERKAEDAVLKTAALRTLWQVTITPRELQAELDRMAARSQAPDRLRELFSALGQDPERAAECLARPLLADRLVRAHYVRDDRLHAEVRERARRESGELRDGTAGAGGTGVRFEVEWRRGLDRAGGPGVIELEPAQFDARVRELGRELGLPPGEVPIGRPSALREDDDRFYVLVVHELDEHHLRLTAIEWPKRPFDAWWSEVRSQLRPAPAEGTFEYRLPELAGTSCTEDTWTPTLQLLDPRYWHTAVWTGTEMIVFGGMSSVGSVYGDGSRYDPATDTWTLLPTLGAPGPRQSHVAVWTGTEMLVWGGRYDPVGYRFDPASDSWSTMSATNAPTPRWNASVVWTGTEMIVWGGDDGYVTASGARYRPATDTWIPLPPAPLAPRSYQAAAWTGSQLVVWGGYNVYIGQMYGDGARWDSTANSWLPVTSAGAPNARFYHTAVWTGDEMVVWGGLNYPTYDVSGGRYDPVSDSWTPTALAGAPSLRWFHVAVWTGDEMLVHGGTPDATAGGRYDPVADVWSPTSTVNAAQNGQGITAVWTGTEMIVWGGLDDDFYYHFDGGRYDPALDVWHPTGTMNVPAARGLHSAEWTGNEMVIWGGFTWGFSRPGGRYDPATDSWSTVTTLGEPPGRENATSVWTGSEVIFWGGVPDGIPDEPGTGGRYSPATDSWTLTTIVNAPRNRYGHTAVWTGSEMIVFGGVAAWDRIPKRYSPATDTWTDGTEVDAPGERDHHTAVWTGTEMIVWGGFINDGITPTGGRYDPVTDDWTPTNVPDSPVTRMWPIGVWTGTEMIVWGGYDWLFVGDLGDGARYDPATDGWTPTTLAGAPSPRVSQGVWTGSELVLWGGGNDSSGGRYDPASDAWAPTTLVNAPAVRSGGRWSTVWTGTEMIIWGGANTTQEGSRYCAASTAFFADGFESGDAGAWSVLVP